MAGTTNARFLKAFRFRVFEKSNCTEELLACSEISGDMSVRINYAKYRDGRSTRLYNIPARAEPSNVTFKCGITSNGAKKAYDWIEECLNGNFKPCGSLTIVLYKDDGKSVGAKWELKNALPVSYKGPSLNAMSSQIAFEELEVCHEGIVRVES